LGSPRRRAGDWLPLVLEAGAHPGDPRLKPAHDAFDALVAPYAAQDGATHLARDVATFSRFGEYRNAMPRGASSGDDGAMIRTIFAFEYVLVTSTEASMPVRKLTLSVDEAIIERARRYSARHQTSISRLVSDFLAALAKDEPQAELSPPVRRLFGLLPREAGREEYRSYLDGKNAK
jgi:hypothetical protein